MTSWKIEREEERGDMRPILDGSDLGAGRGGEDMMLVGFRVFVRHNC